MPSGTEDSAGLSTLGTVAQSKSNAELVAMLGLSCCKNQNGVVSSTLFQAYMAGLLAHLKKVPFFPEVFEELMKSWKAPFTAGSCFASSALLCKSCTRVVLSWD